MHLPAMVGEVLDFLRPKPNGVYVDCTLGDGGHTKSLLEASSPGGFLIGIDRDREAIKSASDRLDKYKERIGFFYGNFADIAKLIDGSGFEKVDGILLDLGVSLRQLMTGERGFSFRKDGVLDMRMDINQKLSAMEVINSYPKADLKKIIKKYGEERYAGRIASAIERERKRNPIKTTFQLADIIRSSTPPNSHSEKVNSITRTFQSIRIAVNGELSSVEKGIGDSVDRLKPGGRICVISYHSLEDRIAKQLFREFERECICDRLAPICVCNHKRKVKILTRKPVLPHESEISANPKVRSAKLRAAERLEEE